MLDEIELRKSSVKLAKTAPKTAVRFEGLLTELQRAYLDLLAEVYESVTGRAPDSKFDLVAAAAHPNTIRALRLKFKALARDMRERVPEFEAAMRVLDESPLDFDPAKDVERDALIKVAVEAEQVEKL